MLRDFKFLRRNSGKGPSFEEVENVPVNADPREPLVARMGADSSSRPPLNTIQEPVQNPSKPEQASGFRSTKSDRTPTKAKGGRYAESGTGMPMRTPEKQGALARNRYGWGPDSRDEGKVGNLNTPRSCRTVGRTANSSYSESNSTQTTPTKSVNKPPNPGLLFGGSSRPPASGGARNGNFTALSRGIPVTCNTYTTVNTVEVPHFDLREDPSFWMDRNVQVLIRIRPLNAMEISMQGYHRCLKQESAQSLTWIGHPETRFTFDHVACETIDQETLFRMVGRPMVENCLSGYNSCMFAYGQTGSGKTHTMLGEINELEVKPSSNRGMTPRMFEFLFARIIAEEESRRDERLMYNCKCSFLEIYNEQITDLLDPSSTNLQLREDVKKGVYVENLTEFEVHTVGDVLTLLSQGSANRRVAATNMNRESSRSHSVFTCVIESRWEKDSTSNLRFARLNLVDLAGSERQKTSGAEGDRLKEAANINKSLSTLGHVIMVLVDGANSRTRHVPYRDSRLTFLLQDSLGGNSKTMIIANVSPSICSATETLNTLKFAQRAKLIQNNAVVNEDASGDVVALQHQIRLLKEELAVLKRHNVSRSLTFDPRILGQAREEHENGCNANEFETDQLRGDNMVDSEDKVLRVSSKQLKSLETSLTGALRREQMTETSIKQLEAEIEQLNRLVRQREEDNKCTKMMLKFREDKIQRMESLLAGSLPADTYLLEENNTLTEEVRMLRAKVDRNPEVTRFALENIRLLEQLRRFQDFYEEGEREMLLTEVSELRDQLVLFLDENNKLDNHPSKSAQREARHDDEEFVSLQLELKQSQEELEKCRNNLNSCLERNAKLNREIMELNVLLQSQKSAVDVHDDGVEIIKESILEASVGHQSSHAVEKNGTLTVHTEDVMDLEPKVSMLEIPSVDDQSSHTSENKNQPLAKHSEEVVVLQLEVDILKTMLTEERLSHGETEKKALHLSSDLKLTEEKVLFIMKQSEDLKEELQEAKSVIEALETQQLMSISELEDLRKNNHRYAEILHEKELKIISLNDQILGQVLRDQPTSLIQSETGNSSLLEKLNKMQDSLEKAKRLNMWYQTDRECHVSNEEEMNEVRRQVEAETAEVIVCLQEELVGLQQQVHDKSLKERETKLELTLLQEKLGVMTECNKKLSEKYDEKDRQVNSLSEEWNLLTREIEEVLNTGHEALEDASNQLDAVTGSLPGKTWVSEQFQMITRNIFEKELRIKELNSCLDDARSRGNEMEWMLRSLKGATLVMAEAHQQDCSEKNREICQLSLELSEKSSMIAQLASQLSEKSSLVAQLDNTINQMEEQIRKASVCATGAFVIVNRFSEVKYSCLEALKQKDAELYQLKGSLIEKDSLLHDQAVAIVDAEKQIQSLKIELEMIEENCGKLRVQLSEEKKHASCMEMKLKEDQNNIEEARERLNVLKDGVSTIKLSMNKYVEQDNCEATRTGTKSNLGVNRKNLNAVDDVKPEIPLCDMKTLRSHRTSKDVSHRDDTIILLKKEIETALESLKGVKAEMAKLHSEKEEVRLSEKQSRKSIESLVPQVLAFQAVVDNFEEQLRVAMVSLDHKLSSFEDLLQESCKSCFQKRKVYELELIDAKVNAAQQAAESSCILAKFIEAQHTIKEADIMINELVIANETMKLDLEELKRREITYINERDTLKDNYAVLAKQFETDTVGLKREVQELEGMIMEIGATIDDDLMPTASDLFCMKSQLHNLNKLTRLWLDDIWSEIIEKDCAMAVLHVCHMGILVEAVTGLNAENGLLQRGLCESNSLVSQLREHNCKSKRELETCRVLQGKLLADIKNSFDRISRKEEETGKLSIKLNSFENKILDLQLQEEAMLERSNYLGYELSRLLKDMDLSNKNQEILKGKDEELRCLEEKSVMDLSAKEIELFILSSALEQVASQRKDLEKEKINMCTVLEKLKGDMVICNVDMQLKDWSLLDKESEVAFLQKEVEMKEKALEISYHHNSAINQKNQMLKISACELENELQIIDAELSNMRLLEEENNKLLMNLKAENCALSQELEEKKSEQHQVLNDLSSNIIGCITTVERLDKDDTRILNLLSERIVSLERKFHEICKNTDQTSMFIEEIESLENLTRKVISENVNLQAELERKDELLEGLVFDLRLLQDSASNTKNQKEEIEELTDSLEALKDELEENVAKGQLLEAQLKEKVAIISMLETDVSRESETVKSLSSEIQMLRTHVEAALRAKESNEEELTDTKEVNEGLEAEIVQMETALNEMNTLIESLNSDLNEVTCERDGLRAELEMAQALAEENEAIATEAKQMAETSKFYAEEKEEEVKVYERSVQELECTVNMLESQVNIVKGEAERQRLQREELELEFHAFKQQLNTVKSSDTDMTRHLDEKERSLQEALQRIQILEKEIASKDAEILQHKAHITELNLNAEAQAREYKHTFKSLEAMACQVKPDSSAPHISNSPSKKLEKTGSRSRGSGSPFKCIGIGLVQQIKSERDEELTTAKARIEELEALAASRQKEIFMLNAKLAMSGSMTHDVLRDLLGIKLDMTTYSSMVDNQLIDELTEKARIHNVEAQVKEQEVIKLKQQLNEFVEERKGWLEEIERKQGEIVAAQISLEQLRQRERLLTTENEMFQTENASHKKNVIELEAEIKKLSGQQNLQQRIHHHAKIKEENNTLKVQNDELSRKLRRTDAILSRVKEELANLRAANGKSPYVYVDMEQQLNEKLKETEEERLQLAQKLVGLCTNILKAAGVTRPTSEVSISMAEEALEQLQSRVTTLERELRDLQYKNRIRNERIRLSELMPQMAHMAEENRQTTSRVSQTPFLSALDR